MSALAILTKCPLAKCPLAKCPLAKCRLAKCPLAKCPDTVASGSWQAPHAETVLGGDLPPPHEEKNHSYPLNISETLVEIQAWLFKIINL